MRAVATSIETLPKPQLVLRPFSIKFATSSCYLNYRKVGELLFSKPSFFFCVDRQPHLGIVLIYAVRDSRENNC
jgi:hypothetical protein